MQSFLNVITLQAYTFFTRLTPRLHGRSKRFFRIPQNLNAPRISLPSILTTVRFTRETLESYLRRFPNFFFFLTKIWRVLLQRHAETTERLRLTTTDFNETSDCSVRMLINLPSKNIHKNSSSCSRIVYAYKRMDIILMRSAGKPTDVTTKTSITKQDSNQTLESTHQPLYVQQDLHVVASLI